MLLVFYRVNSKEKKEVTALSQTFPVLIEM